MTVLVASDVPPAVRGMLKRWFLEPRPNVFVGTLNPRVTDEVVNYVLRLAPGMSLLVIRTANNSQGFVIEMFGQPDRRVVNVCGIQLIAEEGAPECSQRPENSST
jgi:CRISPR-associated protein Cas2